MNTKVNNAIKALYVIAGIQIVTTAYAVFNAFMISKESMAMGLGLSPMGYMGPAVAFAGIIVYSAHYCAQELKANNPWGWVGGLMVFIVSLGGWGVVPAVVGGVSLMGKEVRKEALQKLDLL